jgi:hypothetical protein
VSKTDFHSSLEYPPFSKETVFETPSRSSLRIYRFPLRKMEILINSAAFCLSDGRGGEGYIPGYCPEDKGGAPGIIRL